MFQNRVSFRIILIGPNYEIPKSMPTIHNARVHIWLGFHRTAWLQLRTYLQLRSDNNSHKYPPGMKRILYGTG